MRFLHCADLHCGLTTYSKSPDTRLIDWENAFNNMIEYAKTNSIEYVFICGDLFHQNIPSIDALVVANQCLSELCKVCKYVFLIAGNHDINSISKKRHILESMTLPNLIILDETKVYSNNDWNFNVCHYHYLNSLKILDPQNNKRNIATFHGNVNGAKDDIGNNAGEAHIGFDRLIETNPDYVAMGHIHKRQYFKEMNKEMNKIIPVSYSGSFIQTTFSERNVDKGFLDINLIDAISDSQKTQIAMKFVKNPYIEYLVITSLIQLTKENVKDKIIRIDIPLTIELMSIYKDVLSEASFVTFNAIKETITLEDNSNIEKETIKYEDLDITSLLKKRLSEEEVLLLKELLA